MSLREAVSSWRPVDLAPLLAGDDAKPTPEVIARTDGERMLYPGRTHLFHGETESMKTFAALGGAAQEIAAGKTVLFIDFEDSPEGIVGRLRLLGIEDENIVTDFIYIQPDSPLDRLGVEELRSIVESLRPSLVVLDGMTECLALHGLNPNDNLDVAKFYALVPRPLAALGPAVVFVDHVTKNSDGPRRYGLGAQHKLAGIDGAAFVFETVKPAAVGVEGISRVTVAKDRMGRVRSNARGHLFGELHVVPDGEGVTVEIRPPAVIAIDDGLSPSAKTVLQVLGEKDSPMNVTAIGDRVVEFWPAGYHRSTILRALEDLARAGKADGEGGGTGRTGLWWKTE